MRWSREVDWLDRKIPEREKERIRSQRIRYGAMFRDGNRLAAILLAAAYIKRTYGFHGHILNWHYPVILAFGAEPRAVLCDSDIHVTDIQVEQP